MTVLEYVLARFWDERIWLPSNVTWETLRPNDKIQYADHNHLYYPLPFALGLLFLRALLEKYCYAPIGIHLGIKHVKHSKVIENKELEKLYKSGKKLSHKEVEAAAKQEKMTERQVERWLRVRRAADRPTKLKKFCENTFRFTYYVFSFIFGLVVLWDKPWLWSIKYCWVNYPHQSVSNDVWWYYMISLSFYWSLTMSHFSDVKHKDFWQMFIHHIATIMLMDFSWVCNMHRIGSLVLVVHDCADIFLEAAKMAKYAKRQKICDALFVMFTIIWIVTRLGLFPFWIVRNTMFEAPQMVEMFPAYYIFNSLLLLLLALHIFWTYLILKIAYNAVLVGQMQGDIRSSTNENSDEDSPVTNATENGVKKTN
ncbi:UNVERIFIED_CONTAM: hypothetical protein PYX00_004591 [Menopon gallinae]|uniref:Uncharacterized protein n=1 Tax=Menopon gallinae TaxID=328185 RepID=A0AAW2I6B3_9NEOP